MPTWYPACKVRIVLRLEDNTRGIYPPVPAVTQQGAGPEAFGPGTANPLPSPGLVVIGQDIVPISCDVELNSYRVADTAKVEIPLSRMPVDPRLVRAASVQVFAGVLPAEDFADATGPKGAAGVLLPDIPDARTAVPDSLGGMTNEVFRGFADKHQITFSDSAVVFECRDLTGEFLDADIPPNMLADLPGFLRLDEAIQLLITGDALADVSQDQRLSDEQTKPIGRKRRELQAKRRAALDKAEDAMADDDAAGAAAARAEAQQLQGEITALRAQADALPPASKRFGLPGFRGTKVINDVADPTDPTGSLISPLPTVDEIRPKSWVDSRGAVRKGRKRATGAKAKTTFWDFISEIVTSAGFICYMRAPKCDLQLVSTELVITNPRTYYGASTTAGDTFPIVPVREFTWGSNIDDLELSRSLKGTAVPSIAVRTYDSATGEKYGVIYPPVPKNNRPSTTGTGDRIEIKEFVLDQISGTSVEDIRAKLRAAAMSIYEQLSRGDLEAMITTTALAGIPQYAREGIVGDLFALRPRDPIIVELPADDPALGIVGAGLILDEVDLGKRIEQGRLAGFDDESSKLVADASATQYIQKEFRTTKVGIHFTADAGYEFKIYAINFLDIRDSIAATESAA